MTREHEDTQRRPPMHQPLSPNLEGRVQRPDAGVDFRPDEWDQIKRPIRPPGWRAKRTFVGTLAVQVRSPRMAGVAVPARLSFARVQRPRKAERRAVERAGTIDSRDCGVLFQQVSAM